MMRTLLVVLVLLATPASAVGAQSDSPVDRGDALHADLRPLDAYEAYAEALAVDSSNYAARWRSAREAVNLGMLTADDEARKDWYLTAVEHARAAVSADSSGVDARVWLAISLGRQALVEGSRTRVRLAEEMRVEARRALELDSTSASAHHVLGEWHAEIRRLGGLTRFAASTLLGAETFDEASWEAAERHLRRAVELDPDGIIHRLALGRILLDLDRADEAREQLERVLELPSREPADELHKREADGLLQEIG